MGNMSKQEVIDEMVSEGYDYDSAWHIVFGDIADFYDSKQITERTNCKKHSKKLCSECKYIKHPP